jgi:DNA-binding MarR family transcriptional regulator
MRGRSPSSDRIHPTGRSRASLETACAAVDATCVCTTVRRASRAITRFYDSVVAPSGLRVTQFIVLVAIFRGEGATLGGLANAIGMDRSTLPRNLRPLVGRGWVKMLSAADRRRRTLELTKTGERQLARTIPHWTRAQQRILKFVGGAKWDSLGIDLLALAQSVRSTDTESRIAASKRVRRR